MRRGALLALVLVVVYLVQLEVRHTTQPAALEAHCTTWRIHHPDPRRLVRIVDDCHPLDTLLVPR